MLSKKRKGICNYEKRNRIRHFRESLLSTTINPIIVDKIIVRSVKKAPLPNPPHKFPDLELNKQTLTTYNVRIPTTQLTDGKMNQSTDSRKLKNLK